MFVCVWCVCLVYVYGRSCMWLYYVPFPFLSENFTKENKTKLYTTKQNKSRVNIWHSSIKAEKLTVVIASACLRQLHTACRLMLTLLILQQEFVGGERKRMGGGSGDEGRWRKQDGRRGKI